MSGHVLVITAFGHGHLFSCMELCKHIASLKYKTTLLIFSHLSSSIHPSFHQNPLIQVVQVDSPSPRPGLPAQHQLDTYNKLCQALENLVSDPSSTKPICAVVNVFILMGWTKHIFTKYNVPTVGFFTSGACSPAMEDASWKANAQSIEPGQFRGLPGLPEEMGLTLMNIKRRPFRPPTGPTSGPPKPQGKFGPPGPGEKPDWLDDVSNAVGLMFNTFDDLERPFLDYLSNQLKKPTWGVGPLLPEHFWKSNGSTIRDGEVRAGRQSDTVEDKVIEWLNSKPNGSVLFISFGSSVNLTIEEYEELGQALRNVSSPFIWVIQPMSTEIGYGFNMDLDGELGGRGLIIKGWAPQLLILSHPSTGGFLSHCGWNSTLESLLQGVPMLVCPIRGDQYDNARLIVDYLKVGYRMCEDSSHLLNKHDFVKGINMLMTNDNIKTRAKNLKSRYENGFPPTSVASFHAFNDYINEKVLD